MEQLIKSIRLENNQTVNIYDASKKIAGDRWQVNLVARMDISLDELFDDRNAAYPPVSKIKQVLGGMAAYEIKKQRNFIDDKEKQAVFTDLLDTFLKYSAPYLSNPEFPKRFALKQYNEQKKRIFR